MNLNAIRRRIEMLENIKTMRVGDSTKDDLLSPRDACFLMTERLRLQNDTTLEPGSDEKLIADLLISRIDGMLQRHKRACDIWSPQLLAPADAQKALEETTDRTEEDERQFRIRWMERLGAEREYIRKVIDELDSLKG